MKKDIIEEKADYIMRAIDYLPENQVLIMKLRYIEGKEYKDISKIVGLTVGCVRQRVNRAVQRIHKAFASKLPPEEINQMSIKKYNQQKNKIEKLKKKRMDIISRI